MQNRNHDTNLKFKIQIWFDPNYENINFPPIWGNQFVAYELIPFDFSITSNFFYLWIFIWINYKAPFFHPKHIYSTWIRIRSKVANDDLCTPNTRKNMFVELTLAIAHTHTHTDRRTPKEHHQLVSPFVKFSSISVMVLFFSSRTFDCCFFFQNRLSLTSVAFGHSIETGIFLWDSFFLNKVCCLIRAIISGFSFIYFWNEL